MTIEDARMKKEELNMAIEKLLYEFETKMGLQVEGIIIERFEAKTEEKLFRYVANVSVPL